MKKYLDKTIFVFLVLWLFIDALNGFLISNNIFLVGSFSLGEGIRIFFILVLLVGILQTNLDKNSLVFLSTIILLFGLFLVQCFYSNEEVINNLNAVVKISLPFLLYVFISNNYYFSKDRLRVILYVNAAILLVNLFSSFLGIGFSNYGFSTGGFMIGGVGFFYAGNEVTGALLVIYSLLLYLNKKSFVKALGITLLFFIASIALLSKSSILGTLIIFFVYVYNYPKIKLYKIFSVLLVVFFSIYEYLYKFISLGLQRWAYFIDEYGIFTYLSGGIKRKRVFDTYISKIIENPLLLVFGDGWSGTAEQNFVDLLDAYGIIGIFIFLLWIYWIFNNYKKVNQKHDQWYCFYVMCLVVVVATLAGHIMQSAMIAPFVAILANIEILQNNEKYITTY
ncbi:hypothetical protein LX73_0942 [Fodinibius salinus]|uniref:O-antigen ligase like membrane protein n=1 Tax=Fodinibius salinus TaxID=860790 RepID=A0A5D3YP85_9BACT|nr:hypothetical protein [Fodinibius salinus]TYP95627.1 hypothetical protein LX73_0942 [Fodinibius salinus]